MKYPLVAPLAAFATGILSAHYATFSFRELSIPILFLLALAVLSLSRRAYRAAAASCLAGFLLAGALCASRSAPADPNLVPAVVLRERFDLNDPVRLRGWVRVPPTVRLDRDQFVLAAESIGNDMPATGGIRVSVLRRPEEPSLDLHYGDAIEFLARLRRPRNFQNPGSFDRVGFLRSQDIEMTAAVRASVPMARLPGRRGSRLLAAIWTSREWAEKRIDLLFGPGSVNAAVLKAMVLGDEAYLDRALGVSFQKTGTYHALVVAGLHTGAIAWFLLAAFRRLRVSRGWASLLVMLLLAVFVLLCGSRLPTVRAAALVGGYLIARLLYRQRRPLNLIAGVALALLLLNPAALFDVSFQLSFLSVGVIAAVAAPLIEQTIEPYRLARIDLPNTDRDMFLPARLAQTRIEWRMAARRLPFARRLSTEIISIGLAPVIAVAELAVISATVQLGMALPMAVYFHRITWSGLPANLLVVPLIGLIVPLGAAALLTGWTVLAKATGILTSAMVTVVAWHEHLPWLQARVPAPPGWLGMAFAGALAIFAVALHRKSAWRGPALALLLVVTAGLALHPFSPRLNPGKFELTAIDVGQGDSLFLATPQGQTMLLDSGGLATFGSSRAQIPDVGEEVVSPYLWSRSIKTLDVVVVSHAHYDHIGGLPALLENFRVGQLWVGANPRSLDYDRVLQSARQRAVQVVRVARGDMLSLGGVTFQVLSPAPDYAPRDKPSNDDSLVLLARYGERTFLLTGDIEAKSERRLAADGLLGHADVLKVPHHGSKTSSSEFFLDAVSPWFGVISAGFDNPYGHPHPLILSRLAEHSTAVLRTDHDGAISISTDGHRLSVSAFAWESK